MRNAAGLLGGGAMALGVALAWMRAVPALTGFALFAAGGLVCLVVALATLVVLLRGRRPRTGGVIAVVAAVVFVGAAVRGAGLPRINDFTTDPADPPGFRHAATLPANRGRALDYPREFAAQQQACCPDLAPVHLALPPAAALARVQAVAEAMPAWRLTATDPAEGTIEAVATTGVFGFQDDVIVRVRRDQAGTGSIVDVRSKSRDGRGDLGTNAARIRAFVARLEQGR